MTHWLWVSFRTVYSPLLTSYDSTIMSKLEDRLLSQTVKFPLKERILFLIRPYTFKFWGPYTFADRKVAVKRPYTFRQDRILYIRPKNVYIGHFRASDIGRFRLQKIHRLFWLHVGHFDSNIGRFSPISAAFDGTLKKGLNLVRTLSFTRDYTLPIELPSDLPQNRPL